MTPHLAAVAEAALEASTADYRGAVLQALQREVGFDIGIGWSVTPAPVGPVFSGFDGSGWARFSRNAAVYQPELAPVIGAAMCSGAAIDDHIYGPRRDQLAFVRDIIVPLGLFSGMTLGIQWRGRPLALFRLGRGRRRSFGARQRDRALRLVPLLRAAEVLHHHVRRELATASSPLTRREAALLRLFEEGQSYAGAAAMLGISVNTVRAHVRHVYEKLGVSSKVAALQAIRPR